MQELREIAVYVFVVLQKINTDIDADKPRFELV